MYVNVEKFFSSSRYPLLCEIEGKWLKEKMLREFVYAMLFDRK